MNRMDDHEGFCLGVYCNKCQRKHDFAENFKCAREETPKDKIKVSQFAIELERVLYLPVKPDWDKVFAFILNAREFGADREHADLMYQALNHIAFKLGERKRVYEETIKLILSMREEYYGSTTRK